MSNQHVDRVKKFLRHFGTPTSDAPPRLESDLLSPNVEYYWFAAQDPPIKRSLAGRADVASYLSILQRTYQILEADEHTLCCNGNKVAVIGGERARLLRTGQIVRTDWTAVFEFAADQITKITMTIYSWAILEAGHAKGLLDGNAVAGATGNRTGFVIPFMSRKSIALTAS